MARRKQTKWLKPEGSRYRLPDYYYDPTKVYDWAGDPDSVRSAKDEYIRLRKTAMQRLRSIKKAGFAWTDGYKTFEEYLRPASKLTTPADLAVGLQNLVEFFETPQKTTIRGIRENINKHIEAFKARGIDFISTNEDFHLFTEFLNMRIQLGLAEMYDSEQIIDLFREMKEGGIDPEIIKANFEKFLASTAGKQMRHEWDNVQDEIKDRNYKRLRNKGRPEPGRYDAEVQAKNEIKRRRAKKRNARPAGYHETGTVQKRKEAQRQKRREAYQRRKAKSGNT